MGLPGWLLVLAHKGVPDASAHVQKKAQAGMANPARRHAQPACGLLLIASSSRNKARQAKLEELPKHGRMPAAMSSDRSTGMDKGMPQSRHQLAENTLVSPLGIDRRPHLVRRAASAEAAKAALAGRPAAVAVPVATPAVTARGAVPVGAARGRPAHTSQLAYETKT